MKHKHPAAWLLAGLLALACIEVGTHHPSASASTCAEDRPCWDCTTMGNEVCGEVPYPVKITGSRWAGWHLTWSDASKTSTGGWTDILAECNHDDHPAVCIAVWRTDVRDLGTEQAMIAGLSLTERLPVNRTPLTIPTRGATKADWMSDRDLAYADSTSLGIACSGCTTVLQTEGDFVRHFVISMVNQMHGWLNLGECPLTPKGRRLRGLRSGWECGHGGCRRSVFDSFGEVEPDLAPDYCSRHDRLADGSLRFTGNRVTARKQASPRPVTTQAEALHTLAWLVEARGGNGAEFYGPFTTGLALGDWLDRHGAAFGVHASFVIHPLGTPGSIEEADDGASGA